MASRTEQIRLTRHLYLKGWCEMKRLYALLAVLLLVFTACGRKNQSQDVSVSDVCCPYEITHEENDLLITLRDTEQQGLKWQLEAIPQDVCQIAQENIDDASGCRYRVSGSIEGMEQLRVTALKSDETAAFTLTVMVNVGADGKVVLASHEHRQREDTVVEENGLNYQWNVDVDGKLNFSFINAEDSWSISGVEDDVCIFSDVLSTPSGCRFTAQANNPGQTMVVMVGESTQRTIHVVVQVEENGALAVVSVQEQ